MHPLQQAATMLPLTVSWLEHELGRYRHISEYPSLLEVAWSIAERDGMSEHLGSIISRILDCQGEHGARSLHLQQCAMRFPTNTKLLLEATRAAVDSGEHVWGQYGASRLASRLHELDDHDLGVLWNIAARVGMHSVAAAAYAAASHKPAALLTRFQVAETLSRDPAILAVRVLSLGGNCLPWQICNRWGLRNGDNLADCQTPFDLAFCNATGAARLLEDGLEWLIERVVLKQVTGPDGLPQPANPRYAFTFAFESGVFWTEDNFRRLAERYAPKIASLNNALHQVPCVYVYYSQDEENLSTLVDAVVGATKHDNWRLVILDAFAGVRNATIRHPNVTIQKVGLPREAYPWDHPDCYETEEGVAFEKRVVNPVIAAARAVHVALSAQSSAGAKT